MTHKKTKFKSDNMPFSIYSSSVDAGYEITNLHEDTYGGIKDAPLQGPFTYQYVGGNQHRHVPLNEGSDNIATRPELFHISIGSAGEIKVIGQGDPSLTPAGSLELINTTSDKTLSPALDREANMIYWINWDDNKIRRAPMNGGTIDDVQTGLTSSPRGLALDLKNQMMYWTEDGSSNFIKRAPMTLLGAVTDITPTGMDAGPSGIALDIDNSMMYWTDRAANTIQRCSMAPGQTAEDVQTSLPDDADYIALDPANQMMYWTSAASSDSKVYRAPMSPGGAVEEIATGGDDAYGIALDFLFGMVYWIEYGDGSTPGTHSIKRAPMDGGPTELVTYTLNASRGIALDLVARKMYWTAYVGSPMYRAFMDNFLPPANYTRGEVAKRPLNIANHKTYNPLGNFTYDYEVIQTTGRTSNNRSFVEAEGIGFIGDPSLPYSGSLVTQFVSGARDFMTGTALPIFTRGESVFVNRFNAPGGTDVSSRGVLDTYAEEFAPNNAMPWRNHSGRSQLRAQLTAHTLKPGTLPIPNNDPFNEPAVATAYHTDYRNPKYQFQDYPGPTELVFGNPAFGVNPRGIDVDSEAGKVYWADLTLETINRMDLDGGNPEVLFTLTGTSNIRGLKLDVKAGKIYWVDSGSSYDTLMRANMDGSGTPTSVIPTSSPFSTPRGVALDLIRRQVYVSDSADNKIYRVDMETGTVTEQLDHSALVSTLGGLCVIQSLKKIYFTDEGDGYDKVMAMGLDIPDSETPSTRTDIETIIPDPGSATWADIVVDELQEKIYFIDNYEDTITMADYDGSNQEILMTETATGPETSQRLALDRSSGKIYFTVSFASGGPIGIYTLAMPYRKSFDNAYVTHAIPRCSLDYAWINASATTTKLELPGYQNSGSY